MRKIKGYLLDPILRLYKPLETEDSIYTYYELLHCSLIDITGIQVNGKLFSVVCDDEGLLKDCPLPAIARPDDTLVGACFVTGVSDSEGNLTSLSEADIASIEAHLVSHPGLEQFGVPTILFAIV